MERGTGKDLSFKDYERLLALNAFGLYGLDIERDSLHTY